MSIFGDIADAVGGVADWAKDAVGAVEGVVSDISHSGLGEMGLNLGGSIFGDPSFGSQVKGATSMLDKIFGKGGAGARAVTTGIRPPRLGARAGLLPSPLRAPSSAYVAVRVQGGRVVRVPRAALPRLVALMRSRSPAAAIRQPPNPIELVKMPPPPPPQRIEPGIVNTLLANADAVRAAVDAGQPIKIGTKVIDPIVPLVMPPSMENVARDITAATGLQVEVPPAPFWTTSPVRVTRDL